MRNSSHSTLKPLSKVMLSGTSDHSAWYSIGSGRSGFHTGIGVDTRCWTAQSRSPATALAAVPSTCSSSSSRRLTRTAQEEFTEANAPLANSSTAYAASSAVASYGDCRTRPSAAVCASWSARTPR